MEEECSYELVDAVHSELCERMEAHKAAREPEPLTITREDDGTWIVEGPALQRLMANVNFGDFESRNWFDRMLRQCGLFDRLEEMGIQDGDPVSLYNLEFEYQR